ncbi:hypothetical protein KGQ31_02760 [Patescibacteria group bacterium]|nr:hypothetical protein [Patescibacteria group bacterium]
MISKHTEAGVTWVDMERPTHDEIHAVMAEWSIHPLIGEELLARNVRLRSATHGNFVFFNLLFPVLHRKLSGRSLEQNEIGFVIGTNVIVTVRHAPIDALHQFAKLFEVDSILSRNGMGSNAGFVFFHMMRLLYDRLLHELDSLGDSVRIIEEQIFKGRERAMVLKISEVARELVDAKRVLRPHREILQMFESAGRRFFGEDFSYYSQAIISEYDKVHSTLTSITESVAELRETNNSLLTTKENETMKRIAIIAFLSLPASVITGFFQMSTVHTPLVGQPNDWLIIMLIMFDITIFLFAAAKMRKWF